VDEWFAYLDDPPALSDKTRRPFSQNTRRRYWQSWQRLFAAFPKGPETRLSDVTKGLLVDYRTRRIDDGRAGATINRDMIAVQSFLRWARTSRELAVPVLDIPRNVSRRGRNAGWSRTRSPGSTQCCLTSGGRCSGALVQGSAYWRSARTAVCRCKACPTRHSCAQWFACAWDGRVAATQDRVERAWRPYARRAGGGIRTARETLPAEPSDPVFPAEFDDCFFAYRVFKKARKAAKLTGVTIHDLRHTFAVHAVLSRVPIVRLQKILGHSTPTMTMRCMRHAPDDFFAQDAAKVAASLTGIDSREAAAHAALAREKLKLA
jgi:hypothetical protein